MYCCVLTKKDNSKINLIRDGKRAETKKNEKVATLVGGQSFFGKVTHIQTTVFFYDFHKKKVQKCIAIQADKFFSQSCQKYEVGQGHFFEIAVCKM